MPKFLRALLFALLLSFSTAPVHAENPAGKPATKEEAMAYFRQQAAKLHPQHGKVTLQEGLASLNLSSDFGYLSQDQTEILVHDIWQNPPVSKTLGSIIPTSLDVLSPDFWAIIITYNDDGHVSDEDAEKIDYDKLLQQMKDANVEEKKRREEDGYQAFDLLGWATSPHYDKAAHKLYWATKLQPVGQTEMGLNYNIRILGRKGYLVMTIVGGMQQLPMIESNIDKILSLVDFNTSQRYADFNPGTDKMAAYGMAALIGGTLAAKAGLFKGLLVALIALKKFVILAFVAVVAFFKKLFGRKKSN